MAEDRSPRQRAAINVAATLLGGAALVSGGFLGQRTLLTVGVYGLLVGTSTTVVTYGLIRFTGLPADGSESSESAGESWFWSVFVGTALQSDGEIEEDTGWLIGRLENVLVLTLVIAGAYTALSVIFAAKSWVRMDDTASGNTTYYLAGTLLNFTYSVAVGVVLLQLLHWY